MLSSVEHWLKTQACAEIWMTIEIHIMTGGAELLHTTKNQQ